MALATSFRVFLKLQPPDQPSTGEAGADHPGQRRSMRWAGGGVIFLLGVAVTFVLFTRDRPAPSGPTADKTAFLKRDVKKAVVPVALQRFALNAFLAPLLDDAEPPRWTDVALDFMCDDHTHVLVDGLPMVVGDLVPSAPFHIRWEMGHCEPFGPQMAIAGAVDLAVSYETGGFQAVVSPDHLLVHSRDGPTQLHSTSLTALSHLSLMRHP